MWRPRWCFMEYRELQKFNPFHYKRQLCLSSETAALRPFSSTWTRPTFLPVFGQFSPAPVQASALRMFSSSTCLNEEQPTPPPCAALISYFFSPTHEPAKALMLMEKWLPTPGKQQVSPAQFTLSGVHSFSSDQSPPPLPSRHGMSLNI